MHVVFKGTNRPAKIYLQRSLVCFSHSYSLICLVTHVLKPCPCLLVSVFLPVYLYLSVFVSMSVSVSLSLLINYLISLSTTTLSAQNTHTKPHLHSTLCDQCLSLPDHILTFGYLNQHALDEIQHILMSYLIPHIRERAFTFWKWNDHFIFTLQMKEPEK